MGEDSQTDDEAFCPSSTEHMLGRKRENQEKAYTKMRCTWVCVWKTFFENM